MMKSYRSDGSYQGDENLVGVEVGVDVHLEKRAILRYQRRLA
jgi:hypothetical protein